MKEIEVSQEEKRGLKYFLKNMMKIKIKDNKKLLDNNKKNNQKTKKMM